MKRNSAICVMGAALVVISACSSGEKPVAKPDMALACQTTSCLCEEKESELFAKKEKAPPFWRSNGDAYCATGFELRKVRR